MVKIKLLQTDPIDLLLDDDTHDVVIVNGDLAFSRGLQGLAQCVKMALLMIKGEMFTDLDEGIAWYERDGVLPSESLLGQKYNEAKAVGAVRNALDKIPYEFSILSITPVFDPRTRVLDLAVEIQASWGDTTIVSIARGV